jgi:hypothetical protein
VINVKIMITGLETGGAETTLLVARICAIFSRYIPAQVIGKCSPTENRAIL